MRQVPYYLLIGSGRLAHHLRHYLSLLSLSFMTWERNDGLDRLTLKVERATHILILISDDAIDSFITQHFSTTTAYRIHFSGSLITDKAFGAHPLMSFGAHLYDLQTYQSFPFILDEDAPSFTELLPGLPNQHMRLPKKLKHKYHALCVLSGNFSCMLWQKLFASFETELHLPPAMAHAYLLQQTNNLISNPKTALTGPLVRKDTHTIHNHLAALESDPFQNIYKSFVTCYQQLIRKE